MELQIIILGICLFALLFALGWHFLIQFFQAVGRKLSKRKSTKKIIKILQRIGIAKIIGNIIYWGIVISVGITVFDEINKYLN